MTYPDYGIRVVTAGLHDLNDFNTYEQIRHVTLSNTWVHEDYDGYVGPHDIGLLAFLTPFTLGLNVNVIALPQPDQIHTGIARLHGWGSVSYTFYPSYPNILQTATMPIIPLQTCRISWEFGEDVIHNNHLCAGSLDGGVGGCSLDSGGALVQNDQAVGIMSWGTVPCGLPMRPSVYTRISAYIPWIEGIINDF